MLEGFRGVARHLAAVLIYVAASAYVHANDPSPPPGHTRTLPVSQTRVAPVVDGIIGADWDYGGVSWFAMNFRVSDHGRTPAERTEVRVLADQHALYFAFTCYDRQAEKIRADQTQRGQSIDRDDHVTIELDPSHNHRLISKFSINAMGTQAGHPGEWQGAARRTSDGWTAEIAIPFAMLEFNPESTVFGVNFIRYHAGSQERSHWADVTPQNLPQEAGHLSDLQLPRPRAEAQAIVVSESQKINVPDVNEARVGTVAAQRLTTSVDIDGTLDDRAWLSIPPTTGFVQRDPDEGTAATEETEVRVAYDADALYVGIRMLDREPDKIVRRMSRRDRGADGDAVTVYLDPRHDGLTGVLLQVSAAGVQHDAVIFNDFQTDEAWDAVWASGVAVDAAGWSAEIRIPFSQLRFASGEAPTWGLNVERFIHRKNESAWLRLVRNDERRLASRMARLVGLRNIESRPHLELLPYVASRSELIAPDAGDPFNDGRRLFGASGLDLKWAVSSRFTVDSTINPDFGQVEVDPSVVNLTEFETSFEEKRPFFIEGAQIFSSFGRSGAGSSPLSADLFYSRRIGREPQGSASGDFVSAPAAATILGAAKITGKTASGWSLGLLEAVTSSERARTVGDGLRSETEVEPLTNYFVGRLFHEGTRAGSGFMATAVNRRLNEGGALAARVPTQSYAVGYDGHVFVDSQRRWVVSGLAAGSHVTGSTGAIRRLQTSSRRYFQRPDAAYVRLDPEATSLSGWTSGLSVRRQSGSLRMNASASATSPGFEVNDLGFQGRADQIEARAGLTWSKYRPDWFSRRRSISVNRSTRWNFGGSKQADSWSAETSMTFRNYWYVEAEYSLDLETDDDHLTRGGPLARSPRSHGASVYFGSDDRQRVWIGGGGDHERDSAGGWETSTYASVFVRPSERVRLSIGPYYYRSNDVAQFVDAIPDPLAVSTLATRYVFANLQQTQVSMTTRADVSLSPNVSFQVYIEPFIGVGRYGSFKELRAAKTFSFVDYQDGGAVTFDPANGTYTIDPDDAGSAAAFDVSNDDFNFKSLVAKAVFRWEWRPGSTLYLAWTQDRFDDRHPGEFSLRRDAAALFRAPADDVFLIKMSYWFSR